MTYLPPNRDLVRTDGALELRIPGSKEYVLGLCSGVMMGDDVAEPKPFMRGLGLSNGDAEPFCLVRFICKHLSG